MNRRVFFKALGAAIVVVAAPPVPVQSAIVRAHMSELEYANAIAFLIHSESFPEHRDHYRMKAFKAIRRAQGLMP